MANNIRILLLIFVIHIWTIHSLSLGPPKGSRGTIDWRYPDEIVQPLPSCENGPGVFPHPINCTWYYRCDDRIGIKGFFLRTYYECEPGTVFSDELDQCIFPHDVHPPCGTKGTSLTIPGGFVTGGPAPIGPVTIRPVTVGPVTGAPAPIGPVPDGSFTGVPVTVGPVTGAPLPNSPAPVGSVTDIPVTAAPVPDGLAPDGTVTVGPVTGAPVSTEPVDVLPPVTTVGPPGTPQPESQTTCQIKYSGCVMLNICPLAGSPSFQYQLCQQSKYDCYTDGELTLNDDYCQANSFYNPQSQKCFYHPSAQELCAGSPSLLDYVVPPNPPVTVLETTTAIPTTTTKPEDTKTTTSLTIITTGESVYIPCSDANPRPDTEYIRRKFCNSYALCDNGIYKGSEQLCFNYYQCSKVEDEWSVIKMSCPPGQQYSFKENQCVDELKPEQLCAFFLRRTGVNGVPNAFYY